MSRHYRRYTREFKAEAVSRMAACGNVTALAGQLGVRRTDLYEWRWLVAAGGVVALERPRGRPPKARAEGPAVSPAELEAAALRAQIAALERELGRKEMEVQFLQAACEQVRGAAPSNTGAGAAASTISSRARSRSQQD